MFETTPQGRYDLAKVFAPNIEEQLGRALTPQEMASLAAGVADIIPKYRPSPMTTGLICSGIFGVFALAFKETRKDALKYALGGGLAMWTVASQLDSATQAGYMRGFGAASKNPQRP